MKPASMIVALLFFASPLVVSAQDLRYGVVTSVLSSTHAAHATDLGVGYVRLNFFWSEIELGDGYFDWSAPDAAVSEASSAGLKIFASLSSTPYWARANEECWDNSHGRCFPDLFAWQDFVGEVLDRYSYLGSNITFGVWNEPNLDKFLSGGYPYPYAALFAVAADARDSVSPNSQLAAGETTSGAVADGWLEEAWDTISTWIGSNDIVTFHWYPGDSDDLLDVVDELGSITDGREAWLTETGVASCSERIQGLGLRSEVLDQFPNTGRPYWTKLFVYVLREAWNTCSYHFELVRDDWTKRAAYFVMRAEIQGYSPPDEDDTLSPGEYLFADDHVDSDDRSAHLYYQTDGNLVLYNASWTAVWSSGTDGTVPGFVAMQTDGNLVIYEGTSYQAVWASNTSDLGGGWLTVENGAALTLYDTAGVPDWWTGWIWEF